MFLNAVSFIPNEPNETKPTLCPSVADASYVCGIIDRLLLGDGASGPGRVGQGFRNYNA